MQDIIYSLWFGLAALCITGTIFTLILRAARIPSGTPSAAIAGGIVAGILLGATVLGKTNADLHMHWFVGGVDEHHALIDWQQELDREIAAMEAANVTDAAITEHINHKREAERSPLIADQIESRINHHNLEVTTRWIVFALWCVTILLLYSSSGAFTNSRPTYLRILTLALSGGLTFGFVFLLGYSWTTGIVLGLLASIGSPLPSIQSNSIHQLKRITSTLSLIVLTPLLVAGSIVELNLVDTITDTKFWMLLLGVTIISHDGRWIAAWLDLRLRTPKVNRVALWSDSAKTLNPGVALPQAILASIVFINPIFLLSFILSALIIELCQPIRQPVARWMDEQFSPKLPAD